jgi:predicted hydrocarbon binding protein
MSVKFSNLYKSLKKVTTDPNKSHIIIKNTNIPLILLRPYDLVQLGALIGSSSEDILIWTGKTIGKHLTQVLQESTKEKKHEKLIENILDTLNSMGFGKFSLSYKEGQKASIKVTNPISVSIKEKSDAKVLCNLYNGLFIGIFSGLNINVEGVESECVLDGKSSCIFDYKFEVKT